MKKILPEAVIEAQKNGDVLELTGDDGQPLYFKKANKADLNRYLGLTMKKKLSQATQNLVFDTAIYPDKAALEKMFEEQPGRMVALCQGLTEAIGLSEDFAVKKL